MSTPLDRIVALLDDASPGDLQFILAILEGKERVPGAMERLIQTFGFTGFVNREVNDENFPGANPYVSTEGVRAIHFTRVADALKEIEKNGLKLVMPDKGLRWAVQNRGRYPGGARFVITGQTTMYLGRQSCIMVSLHPAHLYGLYLEDLWRDFDGGYQLLVEPK